MQNMEGYLHVIRARKILLKLSAYQAQRHLLGFRRLFLHISMQVFLPCSFWSVLSMYLSSVIVNLINWFVNDNFCRPMMIIGLDQNLMLALQIYGVSNFLDLFCPKSYRNNCRGLHLPPLLVKKEWSIYVTDMNPNQIWIRCSHVGLQGIN